MSPQEITSIQTEANKLVFEGRRVHVEVEELDRTQEASVPVLQSGRAVGRGLPDDYTGGVKRVVVIDGVDRNPYDFLCIYYHIYVLIDNYSCCGTHLPSLHNLQLFLLPHTDAMSRSNTTSARLYFLSGPRLIAHLTSTHNTLTTTAAIMSCGAPLVPDRVNQVIDERKKSERRVDDLETEIAGIIARSLKDDVYEMASDDNPYKIHLHRTDDTGNVLGFLSSISSAFINETMVNPKPYVAILTSSPSLQTASSTTVVLLFGSDERTVKVIGDALKLRLGVKGGGKGIKWSGKFVGVWKEARESGIVKDILYGP